MVGTCRKQHYKADRRLTSLSQPGNSMIDAVANRICECLRDGRKPEVLVLTGSGISAESGIPTFRGDSSPSKTRWAGHEIAEVSSRQAWDRDPALVNSFFAARRTAMQAAAPNMAHRALAELEQLLGDHLFIVTQNVDWLHQLAGSLRVCQMHGDLATLRCRRCEAVFHWPADFAAEMSCDHCDGELGPNVVLFDEVPRHLPAISELLTKCDLFVAIGTSGIVYPASEFSVIAAAHGALTLSLNKAESRGLFDYSWIGAATTTVPAWVDLMRTALNGC